MPRSGLGARAAALLEYPEDAALPIDSPETTIARRELIRGKPFLRRIYDEWYGMLAGAIPATDAPALELGSGGGFMSEFVPNLITSDILELPGVDRVLDACVRLPFEDRSLRAIAMVNTLHHLPDVERFFAEASRCLEVGGVITMLEPWTTPWSRFVYSKLHHEPFEPTATHWQFQSAGPLSSANGALPWIVFARDRARFAVDFPALELSAIRPVMPLRYLLSGGVSMRALVPAWSFGPLRAIEEAWPPATRVTAMFAHITVVHR
jgi:SAM-dependent methyltransferase